MNNDTLVITCNQLDITKWLRETLYLPPNSPVYFDDADLVYIDKTVMPGILVNEAATLGNLATALEKHISNL